MAGLCPSCLGYKPSTCCFLANEVSFFLLLLFELLVMFPCSLNKTWCNIVKMSTHCWKVWEFVQKLLVDWQTLEILCRHCLWSGDRGNTVVKALQYKSEGRWFNSRRYHWNFSLTSFRSHCGPGLDLASIRNEYIEYFLEVKMAGA